MPLVIDPDGTPRRAKPKQYITNGWGLIPWPGEKRRQRRAEEIARCIFPKASSQESTVDRERAMLHESTGWTDRDEKEESTGE